MRYDFVAVGGDKRQMYLAQTLEREGKTCAVTGMEKISKCVGIGAVADARYVLLPMPLMSADAVNAPFSDAPISLRDIAAYTAAGQTVFCGKADETAITVLGAHGADVEDYFLREELTRKNAAITAEGAISLAMSARERTLLGARCLVTGFGRIAKPLAVRLSALGAHVTVAARKECDRTLARLGGCGAVSFEDMSGALETADVIFNTVPSRVFTDEHIALMPERCMYIELASAPYGADIDELKERVETVVASSLPGKYAPESAAEAIRDTIYHIMEERGWSV